jgi:hypothetical protein
MRRVYLGFFLLLSAALGFVAFLSAVTSSVADAQPIPSSGGVRSVTATAPITSTGGRTPVIASTAAGAATAGHVTTGAQTFGGDKTFNGAIISGVASGGYSLTMSSGARVRFDGTAGTRYCYYDGTYIRCNTHVQVDGNLNLASFVSTNNGKWRELGTAQPMEFEASRSDAAAAVAFSMDASADLATAGALLFRLRDATGSSAVVHFNVDKDGSPVFNVNGGSGKPTCNSTNRGKVWRVQGGAGVADTFEWCKKDAADAYAWTGL